MDYIDSTNYAVLIPLVKKRVSDLMRSVFAYARAFPAKTPAQVAAYADTLTAAIPTVNNSDILTRWIANAGVTGAEALAVIRGVSKDDSLVSLEPAQTGITPSVAFFNYQRFIGDFVTTPSEAQYERLPEVWQNGVLKYGCRIRGTLDGVEREIRAVYVNSKVVRFEEVS